MGNFIRNVGSRGGNMQTVDLNDREALETRFRPPQDISGMAWLKGAQSAQLDLCTELEGIADSLPSEVDRKKCTEAAHVIGPLTHNVHRYEEDVVFPWIASKLGGRPDLADTIERLKHEHFEDECFIEELTDALLRLGSGDKTLNAEVVGYMLRGFFTGIRRHIAFERELLMQAA